MDMGIMTQENKELLLKDLLGRVLYGVKVDYNTNIFTLGYNLYLNNSDVAFENYPMIYFLEKIESVKPYLRPMSSITEEEKVEWQQIFELELKSLEADEGFTIASAAPSVFELDFYNKHHLDYRGLIEKGLALEAPKGMYNI
jgi:hypothetical protein